MKDNKSKNVGRRENRISAMQFLYMIDVNYTSDIPETLTSFLSQKDNDRQFYAFAEELIAGVVENIEAIDDAIKNSATNWSTDKIAKVDLAILRLAIFELLFRDDIPPVVSINEAIDLAKEFSSFEAKRFINGVLDNIKGTLNRPLRSINKK